MLGGMAISRMEATLVGCSLDPLSGRRIVASRQNAVVLPPCSLRVPPSLGQKQGLQGLQSRHHILPRRLRRASFRPKAHSHSGVATTVTTPNSLGTENVLDDLSRFLFRRVYKILSPYLPHDFDPLSWLPESIHQKLHKTEAGAAFLVREALHFGIFYILFVRVEDICKSLHWLYTREQSFIKATKEYDKSSFHGMESPLRLLIVIWAMTRFGHLVAPFLKFQLGLGVTAKTRSVGLVVSVTWFFFNWKQLYVKNLASNFKVDAPRIFAFDKVVSLVMYLVAAACIGEVTGFALRSLLAVGGFSGVALGLAAKEIVSNFFGGAVLFTTRPFVIGERIKAGSISGFVLDIGFLQTKILSMDRIPMIVPNQNFINQVITNYSRAKERLLDEEFPILHEDIVLAERITSRVVQYLRDHPEVDLNKSNPLCYVKSLNETGVKIAVNCVMRPLGGAAFYGAKQAVLVSVAQIILEEGATLGCNSPFELPYVPKESPAAV